MNEQTINTLTVKEMREILRIGSNSAYSLIHSNRFPVKKIGCTYRIPKESFFLWLEQQDEYAAST